MSHSFACKDTGLTCEGEFTAATEEELMEQIEEHYGSAHLGVKPMEYRLKRLIKTE